MANNVAFRFLGKMAMDCSSIAYNASTGNVTMLAVDVGIKVLELAESVISYGEEKKRTNELRKQVNYMKQNIDRAVEIEKEKDEEALFLLQQKLNEDLKFEKVKLAKDIDEYRRFVELNMNGFNYKYEEQKKINELLITNVRRYKMILNKIEECINIQNKNADEKNNIYDLYEEFRKTQILYNKLIKSIN